MTSNHRRSRRITQLIVLLCFLSLVDLCFTIWAQSFTAFNELNPIARRLLQQNGFAGLVLMKMTLTALGASIFWRLRVHRRAEAALWGVVIIYLLLTVRWSNYTAEVVSLSATPAVSS